MQIQTVLTYDDILTFEKIDNAGSWRALLKYMRMAGIVLELYKHTNQQMAAHNIWETSWPAFIALPLLPAIVMSVKYPLDQLGLYTPPPG